MSKGLKCIVIINSNNSNILAIQARGRKEGVMVCFGEAGWVGGDGR